MAQTLTVPPARDAPPKDLEFRPRQFKAWVESLPMQRSAEAAQKLHEHLAAMNRCRVETDDRIEILDLERPFALAILEDLDAIYARSSIPLPARAREALAVAQGLADALATGHLIAAAEKAGKLIAFGARKQVPRLLYSALECVQAGIRSGYKSYTPVPEGLWRRAHEIYLYAEAEGIAAEIVDPSSKATIADLYAEVLLLALSDPYRLPSGEVDRILAQVRSMRTPVSIGQKKPSTPPGCHFLVPCDTDQPPKPALSANDERGGPNWRLFDTSGLVDKLRARRLAHERGQVSAASAKAMGTEGLALLSKLITLWGSPPKRTSRRDPMDTSVAICVGLKAVSHYVSLEPRVDPQAEADIIRRGITVPLVTFLQSDESQAHPVTEWDVVNQSKGGIKVRRASTPPQSLAVGEVVGVKLMGRPRWSIGVVRWITMMADGGIEFGIQFIGSCARPVWIQATSVFDAEPKMGLLLDEPSRPATSLLVPPSTFADLREFEVDDAGNVVCVRATNLLDKTGRFERFEFSQSREG
jgi:hypothetical protein